jgi:hypothetical protein
MCAKDNIIRPEVRANTNGNGFLTNVSMAGTVDQSALMRLRQLFLATADEEHLAIKAKKFGGWESLGIFHDILEFLKWNVDSDCIALTPQPPLPRGEGE